MGFSHIPCLGRRGALNFKYAWVEHGLGWEIDLWLHFIFISYFSCQYLSHLQLSSFLWEFQFSLQKQHYMHILCPILDRGLGMSYSGVIRLFYVPKSYPSVSGEPHVHLVGAGEGGSPPSYHGEEIFWEKEIFENCLRWELTLHATWPYMTLVNQTRPHQKSVFNFFFS